MLAKLSVYLVLLLILPDIYIYRLFIRKHTANRALRILWFCPSLLLFLGLIAVLFVFQGGHTGIDFIGIFTITFMVVALPKICFMLFSLLDLPLKYGLKTRFRPFGWLGLIVGVTASLMVLYGTFWGRKQFEVKQVVYTSPHLPASFDGYRIAQISDIHAGSWRNNRVTMQKAIDLINAQGADIIAFTGDLVNNDATELNPFLDILSRLHAPDGVYSILGNHDYGPYVHWHSEEAKEKNLQDLKDRQADMGWLLLNNEHVLLHRGTDTIALIGVENNGEPPFSQYSDLPAAMQGTESYPFKILLSHNPTHWRREVLDTDIDLMLAGHTHAMQIALGRLSPSALLYPEWSGMYKEGDQGLYVNVGLGLIGLIPMRFGAWPEITVITLKQLKMEN